MEEHEELLDNEYGYDLVDPYIKDPWVNLANAIVILAARDYRDAISEYKVKAWRSLEKFFNSDWYKILTNVPANELLSRLREEQKDKYEVLASTMMKRKCQSEA